MIQRARRLSRLIAVWSLLALGLVFGDTLTAPMATAAPLGQFAGTLTFTVDEITPALVTSGGPTTLRIVGSMTNTGSETLTTVVGRIQRGDPFESPAALQEELANPGQPATRWTAFAPMVDSIEPGATAAFVAEAALYDSGDGSRNNLAINALGVYPIMINVNAQFASAPDGGARVGELHALLTVASTPAAVATDEDIPESPIPALPVTGASQPVNVVMPLVDRPHRDATGAFFDDDLTASISPGGRLDRVLTAAESAALPAGALTLAVDPELLEELDLMSKGYVVGPVVFALGADTAQTSATPTSATETTGAETTATQTTATQSSEPPGTTPQDTTGTTPSFSAGGTAAGGELPPSGNTVQTGPSTTGLSSATDEGSPGNDPSAADRSPMTSASASASASETGVSTSVPPTTSAPVQPPGSSPGVSVLPGPDATAGTGATAAADFLVRLRTLSDRVATLVLPYSDIDSVALTAAGHGDQIAAAVADGREIAGATLGQDARLITDVAWPIDGFVDDATLDLLRAAGLSTAVLDVAGVSAGDGTNRVAGDVATPSGTVAAVLSSSAAPEGAIGLNSFTAAAAQNFFSGVTAPQVFAPYRGWEPTETALPAFTSLLTELGQAGIVSGAGIEGLGASASPTAMTLTYPAVASERQLSAGVFQQVADLTGQLDQTQTAFTPVDAVTPEDAAAVAPTDLFADLEAGMRRQAAGGFRTDRDAAQRAISVVPPIIADVQDKVRINKPTAAITLTSSSSPLLVTIRNDQPYTVYLRIQVDPDDAKLAGIQVQDVGVLAIQPNSTRQVTVPAEVSRPGSLSLGVQLTNPAGVPWGAEETFALRSTAYGAFTIGLIVGAAGLVVLSGGIRIRKRYVERRQRIAAGLQ